MDDTLSSSHPLNVARTNDSVMALEILVVNFAFQHVSDSLKASMWVVRESSRQLNFEQIKHQKRI